MNKTQRDNAPAIPVTLLMQMVVCALAVVSLLYIPVPILPILSAFYQLPADQAGLPLSAFGLMYATGFLFFGPLSDRLGRKVVLVGGLSLLTVITVGLIFVHTPKLFIAGRALQGFAAASFPPVALAYLSERGTPSQRVWGVAWMSTAFLSAGLLGQIYGSTVATHWNFALALIPLAMFYSLTALRLLGAPGGTSGRAPTKSFWAGYKPIPMLLGNAELRRVYVPASVLLMAFVAFYISMDTHLADAMAEAGIGRVQARSVAVPAFLAPLLAAKMVGRWGAQRVASTGLFIAAMSLFLCAAVGKAHVYLFLTASVIFAAGVAISIPGLIACVSAVAKPEVRGLAVSLYTFLLFVGASLGPWFGSYAETWGLEISLAVLAAVLGAAAIYSVAHVRNGGAR